LKGNILFGGKCNELREVPKVVENVGEGNWYDVWSHITNTPSDASTSSCDRTGEARREKPRSENAVPVDTRLVDGIARAKSECDRSCEDSHLCRADLNHHEAADVRLVRDRATEC